MRYYYPETENLIQFGEPNVDEIIELAEAQLGDNKIGAHLRRVGVFGDLTESEQDIVDNFLAEYVKNRGWVARDFFNMVISTALARRWIDGHIGDVRSDEARAFIENRLVRRTHSKASYPRTTISVGEGVVLAKDIARNDILINMWRNFLKKKEHSEELGRLYTNAIYKYSKKYGWFNRDKKEFARYLIEPFLEGKANAIDAAESVEAIRRMNMTVSEYNIGE